MGDESDLFDDWLFKSLKSYRHLHMFELSQPTCVIEWNGRDGVCVAGCNLATHNEILEMGIPAKLMQESSSEAMGLTKDRDFKMLRGGFSDKAIHCLKYLRGTSPRLIVTGSHSSPDLDVWQLGTETSDVIKKMSTLPGRGAEGRGVRGVAQRPCYQSQVVFGSTISDVEVVDVETKKVIATDFGKADNIIEFQFFNEHELVMCNTHNGLINIHDLRTTFSQSVPSNQLMNCSKSESEHCTVDKATPSGEKSINQSDADLETSVPTSTNQDTPKKREVSWTFDLNCVSASDSSNADNIVCKKPRFDVAMATIVRLCSNGEIIINDLRNLQTPLHFVRLANGKTQYGKSEFLTIKWCPTEKNLLSVSGLNGCVDIYDISKWQQCSNSPPIVKPIFSHEGHMMGEPANQKARILCHTWHPRQPHVVMSSGDDGSLHAWDWSAVS